MKMNIDFRTFLAALLEMPLTALLLVLFSKAGLAEEHSGTIKSLNPYSLETVIGGRQYVLSGIADVILSDKKTHGSIGDLKIGDLVQIEATPVVALSPDLPPAPSVITKVMVLPQ